MLGRRHHDVRIIRGDSRDHLTGIKIPSDNGLITAKVFKGPLFGV